MNVQTTLFETTPAALESLANTEVEEIKLYQVAKILNQVLVEMGIEKDGVPYQVRPQMVYNYGRQGMVVKGQKSSEAITPAQAYEFITKFVAKFTK
jgi:hypothetical protein